MDKPKWYYDPPTKKQTNFLAKQMSLYHQFTIPDTKGACSEMISKIVIKNQKIPKIAEYTVESYMQKRNVARGHRNYTKEEATEVVEKINDNRKEMRYDETPVQLDDLLPSGITVRERIEKNPHSVRSLMKNRIIDPATGSFVTKYIVFSEEALKHLEMWERRVTKKTLSKEEKESNLSMLRDTLADIRLSRKVGIMFPNDSDAILGLDQAIEDICEDDEYDDTSPSLSKEIGEALGDWV